MCRPKSMAEGKIGVFSWFEPDVETLEQGYTKLNIDIGIADTYA